MPICSSVITCWIQRQYHFLLVAFTLTKNAIQLIMEHFLYGQQIDFQKDMDSATVMLCSIATIGGVKADAGSSPP